MSGEFSQSELDALLEEVGATSETIEQSSLAITDESLENLLKEIISTEAPASTSLNQKAFTPEEKQKPKKKKLYYALIRLGCLVTASFFLGSVCGGYWSHLQHKDSNRVEFKKIDQKLVLIADEIKEIYEMYLPVPIPEEMIEPIEIPTDLDILSPKMVR